MGAELCAALVLVRSAGAPDAGVERARDFFAQRGFEVGPLVGAAFSIEAPRERMERQFADFEPRPERELELSLDRLPAEIRGAVQAVAVEAPPAFGPDNP